MGTRDIELALTAAGDEDVCTLRNQAFRRSETDSAIASRDDCYFSFQLSQNLSPIWFPASGNVFLYRIVQMS